MINKSDDFTRRILNFPAIRLCESVSFSSLLASLINLGHTICGYKLRTLFTNKKNARNLIRVIESLVVFLEEIRNGDSRIEGSFILSLSELQWIFQKVLFLLEDCTRDDARLWMLVKSEKVSTHFCVLMRAIALAIDVMPLVGLDVAVEAKELVEFVRKQALKATFEVERDDKRVIKKVVQILDTFEGGIAPESNDLRRILEHLGIRSWNECNKEVKFLESEIGQECLTSEKRDVGFLSSLMAFMIFCRCSLFVNFASVGSDLQQSHGGRGCEMIRNLNSDDFRCPITLEIMTDPVTISTGHTYDRSSIWKWFRSGNHTCPKTGERLISVDLVPNLALKRLIKRYYSENGIPFPESDVRNHDISRSLLAGAGSLAASQAMSLVAKFLVGQLVAGTNQERKKAAYEIRLLTKSSNFNRSCFVEVDAIPSLLLLLCLGNPGAQENAMAALLNLSKHPKSKKIMVENGGLNLIIGVLEDGLKTEARQHAAGILYYIASVEDYRRTIGKIPGAIPGLVGLLGHGPDRAKKNALFTILMLLPCPENHWMLLSAGLVPLLVNVLVSSEREELITYSLAVLATLAEKPDGSTAIVSAGTLPIIIEVLSSSDSRSAKEYCVSLLLALCINAGADVVSLIVTNPSLMASLYSLLTDGTSQSSKKASSLIRILHAFNQKNSLMASTFPQDPFIHAW